MKNVINTSSTNAEIPPVVNALLDVYEKKTEAPVSSDQALKVSRAVSFFAFWYERMRNAIEYREDHLIRRAAIERILKRRLLLNGEGKNVSEHLIRELLWARYLPNMSIPETKVPLVQKSITKYLYLRREIVPGRPQKEQGNLDQFIMDLLSCEIEEILAPNPQREAFVNFVYQSIVSQINLSDKRLDAEKNIMVYTAVDQGFAKSDIPLIRYHLTKILLPELISSKDDKVHEALLHFMQVYNHIEKTLKEPVVEKLRRFIKRNSPPYLVLRDLIESKPKEVRSLLNDEPKLKFRVDEICRKRYQETSAKLRRAGVRSIIYIFLTKMVFAILLEYPVDKYFQNKVELGPIAINVLFPPFLMFLVVVITHVPGAENTRRIFERIVSLIKNPTDMGKTTIKARIADRRPLLTLGFSILYLLAFILSFGTIFFILSMLKFNIISQGIFIFFVSMVLFFGYRIRQSAKEYLLIEKEGILSPIRDFFMLPVLSLGKWLSSEIARLNIFIFIFDFIVEAPFKAIFEIGEEWINFVRNKKEEFT